MQPVLENETLLWLNAAKLIGESKKTPVICPSCKQVHLEVKDILAPEEKTIDRYLICNSCGNYNVVKGNFKDSEFYSA